MKRSYIFAAVAVIGLLACWPAGRLFEP